ncbi:hypothetical protein TIFTF001_005301 [Ficus carica]|uniref:Uncharacterized protein n=1 Tax=Ficus carica TaxID=3494 RepID=A0AA87ZEI9_FICCA|nr:hypothetical protein TIFTF001_005301 [Ficus carica]
MLMSGLIMMMNTVLINDYYVSDGNDADDTAVFDEHTMMASKE